MSSQSHTQPALACGRQRLAEIIYRRGRGERRADRRPAEEKLNTKTRSPEDGTKKKRMLARRPPAGVGGREGRARRERRQRWRGVLAGPDPLVHPPRKRGASIEVFLESRLFSVSSSKTSCLRVESVDSFERCALLRCSKRRLPSLDHPLSNIQRHVANALHGVWTIRFGIAKPQALVHALGALHRWQRVEKDAAVAVGNRPHDGLLG